MATDSLNLYAKLEHLIPYNEELQGLYEIFIEEVKQQNPNTILDVGCGSGKFAKILQDDGLIVSAIDISKDQIKKAQALGVDATCIDICEVEKTYSCITAVFDVLNYLDANSLDRFLSCVARALEPGGIFIADINTLYGFEEIAQGALILQEKDLFATLESQFSSNTLTTDLNMFTKDKGYYKKKRGEIIQYFHPLDLFLNRQDLKLIKTTDIYLFCDESDKTLLTLEKR